MRNRYSQLIYIAVDISSNVFPSLHRFSVWMNSRCNFSWIFQIKIAIDERDKVLSDSPMRPLLHREV